MSPREKAQQQIKERLEEREDYWNAPYGIIASIKKLPKGGAVRSIVFGVSAWLDAEITIWSPSNITVEAQGAMADRFAQKYESVDELLCALDRAIL